MIGSKVIPLTPWHPDQPDLDNGLSRLVNAIPQAKSYRSVNSLVSESDALDGRPLRSITAKDSTGSIFHFAGDGTKLYRMVSNAYTNVSQAGDYTVSDWQMVKFGDRIIAVSKDAAPQYFDMGTSTLFADLPGTPPNASCAAVIRDFVVLGDVDDGGTQYPSRIVWSGYNNSELWDVDLGTQSDFQDLFGSGGKIQRIVPGEYGVIFQESSIWRMDYVGPPTIFKLDEVERGRGTLAPNSVTWLGDQVYYWGHDGFYSFNGQFSTPIGSEKVDRYVKDRLDTSRYSEFHAGIDRRNNLVIFTFPHVNGGMEMVAYNWAVGEWGQADVDIAVVTEFADTGYDLDSLDLLFADIDSESIPVDSTEFLGGSIRLAVFCATDKTLCSFTGDPLTAEIETGEILPPNGTRVFISSARPVVEGLGDYSIALGDRNKQSDVAVFGPSRAINGIGEAQFHKNVRFPRFRLELEGGFTHASGIEVHWKPAGRI